MCRFFYLHLICPLSSPRLSYFSQRGADPVEVPQDFIVGLEHAGLVVGDTLIPAEVPDDRLRFSQLVARHPWEEVVFDLADPLPSHSLLPCRSRTTELLSIQLLLSSREDAVAIAKHDYLLLPSVDLLLELLPRLRSR